MILVPGLQERKPLVVDMTLEGRLFKLLLKEESNKDEFTQLSETRPLWVAYAINPRKHERTSRAAGEGQGRHKGCPQETQGCPQEIQEMPTGDSRDAYRRLKGCPQETQGCPQETQGCPQETQEMPTGDSRGVHRRLRNSHRRLTLPFFATYCASLSTISFTSGGGTMTSLVGAATGWEA